MIAFDERVKLILLFLNINIFISKSTKTFLMSKQQSKQQKDLINLPQNPPQGIKSIKLYNKIYFAECLLLMSTQQNINNNQSFKDISLEEIVSNIQHMNTNKNVLVFSLYTNLKYLYQDSQISTKLPLLSQISFINEIRSRNKQIPKEQDEENILIELDFSEFTYKDALFHYEQVYNLMQNQPSLIKLSNEVNIQQVEKASKIPEDRSRIITEEHKKYMLDILQTYIMHEGDQLDQPFKEREKIKERYIAKFMKEKQLKFQNKASQTEKNKNQCMALPSSFYQIFQSQSQLHQHNTLIDLDQQQYEQIKLNQLEHQNKEHPTLNQCKLIEFLQLSGFNPPTISNKLNGDLFYLHFRSLENIDYHITASVYGFYVNQSKLSHFNSAILKQKCIFISLIELICHLSDKFVSNIEKYKAIKNKKTSSNSTNLAKAKSNQIINLLNKILQQKNTIPQLLQNSKNNHHCYERLQWLTKITKESQWNHIQNISPQINFNHQNLNQFQKNYVNKSDWNNELTQFRYFTKKQSKQQECFGVKKDSKHERDLYKRSYNNFEEAAIEGAQLLVDGKIHPINSFDMKQKHIYIYNNIFFSVAETPIFVRCMQRGEQSVPSLSAINTDLINLQKLLELTQQPQQTFQEKPISAYNLLHFIIVQYRGYKIIAQMIIPGLISTDFNYCTRYGSIDDGTTVHNDPQFHVIMKSICKHFNVRDDVEVIDGNGVVKLIAGNPDIKGIKSMENRNYIVDLFRLSPRDLNYPGLDNDTCVIRHQLIEKYYRSKGKPQTVKLNVNIGTHTNFKPNEETKAQEQLLENMAKYLKEQAVPNLISVLRSKKGSEYLTDSKGISKAFHQEGVNLRYLGYVCTHPLLKLNIEVCLCLERIILVKSLKHLFNLVMRSTHITHLNMAISHVLNCIFGSKRALHMLNGTSNTHIKANQKIHLNIHQNQNQSNNAQSKKKKKKKLNKQQQQFQSIHEPASKNNILASIYGFGHFEDNKYLHIKPSNFVTMKPSDAWDIVKSIAKCRYQFELLDNIEVYNEKGLFRMPYEKYATLRDVCLTIGLVLQQKHYNLYNSRLNHHYKSTKSTNTTPPTANLSNIDELLPFRPKNIVRIIPSAKKIKISSKSSAFQSNTNTNTISQIEQMLNKGMTAQVTSYLNKSLSLYNHQNNIPTKQSTIFKTTEYDLQKILQLAKISANVQYMNGNTQNAAEIQCLRIAILYKLRQYNSSELILAFSRAGLYFMSNQSSFQPSLFCLYKSVNMMLLTFGENYPDLLIHLANMARVHQHKHQHEQASVCFLKAIEIYQNIYQTKNHFNISFCYNSLAMLFCSIQDMKRAVQYQTETVSILMKLLNENDPRLEDSKKILKVYKEMVHQGRNQVIIPPKERRRR